MKISAEQIRKSLKYARQCRGVEPGRDFEVPFPEVVKQAQLRLLNSSDLRLPEVNKVREMIQRHKYQISPEDVAEKLLGRILSDKLR